MPGLDRAADAREVELTTQQLAQRRVVEQRARRRQQPAAGQHRQRPVQARAKHSAGIGAEHLADLEIAPDPLQVADRDPETIRMHRDCSCIHRPGGGAGDDWKWIGRSCRQQIRDGPQHADLVGRPRTATRQHQPDPGRHSGLRFALGGHEVL
jgi:hypothetical protein